MYNGVTSTVLAVCAGMPNAADMPMLLERPQNNGVELTWRTQSANVSGPILYLVSSRSNVGRHFSDVDMTSWQVLAKVSHWLTFFLLPAHYVSNVAKRSTGYMTSV